MAGFEIQDPARLERAGRAADDVGDEIWESTKRTMRDNDPAVDVLPAWETGPVLRALGQGWREALRTLSGEIGRHRTKLSRTAASYRATEGRNEADIAAIWRYQVTEDRPLGY